MIKTNDGHVIKLYVSGQVTVKKASFLNEYNDLYKARFQTEQYVLEFVKMLLEIMLTVHYLQ